MAVFQDGSEELRAELEDMVAAFLALADDPVTPDDTNGAANSNWQFATSISNPLVEVGTCVRGWCDGYAVWDGWCGFGK